MKTREGECGLEHGVKCPYSGWAAGAWDGR